MREPNALAALEATLWDLPLCRPVGSHSFGTAPVRRFSALADALLAAISVQKGFVPRCNPAASEV
jgi:hypothetical protein